MATKRSKATRRGDSERASARAAAIRAEQARQEQRRRTLVVSAVVVVVLALILAIGYGVQSSRDGTAASAAPPAGTVGGLAVPAGPASAPAKVTVYEDFLCPYCGQFEAASSAALDKDIAAGNVQMQYHVLNFLPQSSTTDYSLRAANALGVVLNASGQQVAKTFHDLLYAHQPQEGSAGLSDGQLVDYAVQAGAKRRAVTSGITGLRYKSWVAKVTDRASKAGVNGTPTVTIDGKTVAYSTPQQLVAKVEQAVRNG